MLFMFSTLNLHWLRPHDSTFFSTTNIFFLLFIHSQFIVLFLIFFFICTQGFFSTLSIRNFVQVWSDFTFPSEHETIWCETKLLSPTSCSNRKKGELSKNFSDNLRTFENNKLSFWAFRTVESFFVSLG